MRNLNTRTMTIIWAVVVGLVSGLICVGVRLIFRVLQWVFIRHIGTLPEAATLLSPTHRLFTPILGAIFATLVLWLGRRWSRTGRFEEYVEAVRFEDGQLAFMPTLWRTASSAFSIATGAAIGREGSMIQFAAACCSWIGQKMPPRYLSLDRQVAYGAAAAVAAVYQAPLAGVFFAIEIILANWKLTELPELLSASTTGWLVSSLLLGRGPLFATNGALQLSWSMMWVLPLVLLMGLLAPLYQSLLRSFHLASRLPFALVWSGIAVGGLSLLSTTVWGNGDVALLHILTGSPALSSVITILLLRLIATSFCVGTGTVGGVFTPTLFTGASVGLAAGYLLHVPQPVFLAVAGLSAFLAAVTHAPCMAALMATELTGQWHLLPLLLVLNLISYAVARSISLDSLYAIATPTPIEPVEHAPAINLQVS